MAHRGFDPETFPSVLFIVAVLALALFILVTVWAMRANAREARSPRLRCYSAECAATHRAPVGVFAPGVGARGPRATDHLAIRRSFKVFWAVLALALAAAAALWVPVGSASLEWEQPFRLAAYAWWALPLGAASAAVWTVMIRADRKALKRLH